jgi:hypothetical protein
LKKEFIKELRVEDLTLVNKSFISSDYEECESDIVYTAKIGDSGVLNFTYDIFDVNNGFTKK